MRGGIVRGALSLAIALCQSGCTTSGREDPSTIDAAVDGSVAGDGSALTIDAQITNCTTPALPSGRYQTGSYSVLYGTLHDHVYAKDAGDDGGLKIGESEPSQTGSPAWWDFRRQNPTKYAGGDPRGAITQARASGIDFFALTPHNHLITGDEYSDIVQAVREAQCAGFPVLFGQEFSTVATGNHALVLGPDIRIGLDNGRFDQLFGTWLPSYESSHTNDPLGAPFIIFAHPAFTTSDYTSADKARLEYGIDDFQTTAEWATAANRYGRLVEILSGGGGDAQSRTRFFELLNMGARIGVSAGEDNHDQQYGTRGDGRVGVLVDSPTAVKVAEALRERRTFVSEDKTFAMHALVKLSAGNRYMGSDLTLAETTSTLMLEIGFQDSGEANANYRVEVYSDSAVGGGAATALTLQPFANTVRQGTYNVTVPRPGVGGYLIVHVTQLSSGGNANDDAWASPFFIRP